MNGWGWGGISEGNNGERGEYFPQEKSEDCRPNSFAKGAFSIRLVLPPRDIAPDNMSVVSTRYLSLRLLLATVNRSLLVAPLFMSSSGSYLCRQYDAFFPQFRSFDWFSGHSWARGLLFAFDGKDQVMLSLIKTKICCT